MPFPLENVVLAGAPHGSSVGRRLRPRLPEGCPELPETYPRITAAGWGRGQPCGLRATSPSSSSCGSPSSFLRPRNVGFVGECGGHRRGRLCHRRCGLIPSPPRASLPCCPREPYCVSFLRKLQPVPVCHLPWQFHSTPDLDRPPASAQFEDRQSKGTRKSTGAPSRGWGVPTVC